MGPRLPALTLIVTATFLFTGCGSGSSKAGSSTADSTNPGTSGDVRTSADSSSGGSNSGRSNKRLSAIQLVAKADEICRRLNAEITAAKTTVQTQQDIMRVASQRAAIERVAVVDMSKLNPPASMERDWQEIILARKMLIEDLTKVSQYAAAKNTQNERPLYLSSANLARHMAATAQHSGFKYCGQLG